MQLHFHKIQHYHGQQVSKHFLNLSKLKYEKAVVVMP